MLSYEQEQVIREEEQVREAERTNIRKKAAARFAAEEAEEEEIQHLRAVAQEHGVGAAYLVRMTPFLISGVMVGIVIFFGTFIGAKTSFFTTLWEAIKMFAGTVAVFGVFGLWKCLKI